MAVSTAQDFTVKYTYFEIAVRGGVPVVDNVFDSASVTRSRLASSHAPHYRAAHRVVCVVHVMCTMRHDRFAKLSP